MIVAVLPSPWHLFATLAFEKIVIIIALIIIIVVVIIVIWFDHYICVARHGRQIDK